MKSKNILIQLILALTILLVIFFFYFYLPSEKNKSRSEKINISDQNQITQSKNKNVFENVEYISTDSSGRKTTTKATLSYFYQEKPEIIFLENPYSFTLMKDKSLLEIRSKRGEFNKITRDATYRENVIITNKNYIIDCLEAIYVVKKNLIKLNGEVVIQDPPNKIYSDRAILDTITNNAEAFMNSPDDRVLTQKYK